MTTPITVTLADLLATPTQQSLVADALGVLGLPGSPFPTAAWQPTDVPYVLVSANAAGMLDVAGFVPQIAAGGLLGLATGDWLTLLAASNFETYRNPAVSTIRMLTLVDTSGAPSTFAVGDVTAVSVQGVEFTNASPGTLPANGVLPMPFVAVVSGATGDNASGPWTMQTAIAGVSITESTVQIVRHGSNAESDDSLTLKCVERWGTLGAGANDAAYAYWSKTAPGVTESVTRVRVLGDTPLPGQVTLYLATDTAPVTSVGTVGPVSFNGAGVATLTVTADAVAAPYVNGVLVVTALTSGAIGAATFSASFDGGATTLGPFTTAASVDFPAQGVTLAFAGGALVAGDVWQSQLYASTTGLVQAYIYPGPSLQGKAPTCVDVFVYPAAAYPLTPVGTVYLASAATHSAVVSGLPGLFASIAQTIPVGGTLYRALLIQKIMELPGVVNVTFTSPPAFAVGGSGQITLGANEILSIGSIAGLAVTP